MLLGHPTCPSPRDGGSVGMLSDIFDFEEDVGVQERKPMTVAEPIWQHLKSRAFEPFWVY